MTLAVRRLLLPLLVLAALLAAAVAGVLWWQHAETPLAGERRGSFPELAADTLDADQVALVRVLEQEFAAPGTGPDYAEGVTEPWCADFVSWTMRAAGRPLANPNSGSWRIPGVYTLEEYYRAAGRFAAVDSGYRPRTGDVLLYGPDSPFGQHTNIVLTAEAGTVTTIGGNEGDEIRIHTFDLDDVGDVVGYGKF